MATNQHFRLSKTTKRITATILDKGLRDAFHATMVHAEACALEKPKEKEKNPNIRSTEA